MCVSSKTSLSITFTAKLACTERMCGTEQPLETRWAVAEGSRLRCVCVCVCVCVSVLVSAHTHCGLVMLLENGRDVIGLLLFLLCVVLDQRQPVSSPAAGLMTRLARWGPVNSSFAAGGPASGTGLTGQLSATVWTQSEQVRQMPVVQAAAPR